MLYPPGLGRPSIAPERLLRAMLLQAFYGIRSERQLMERMEFDLLFRWFVGLGVDDLAWDHSSFTKNRDRLLEGEIAAKFLRAVLAHWNTVYLDRAVTELKRVGRNIPDTLLKHISPLSWEQPDGHLHVGQRATSPGRLRVASPPGRPTACRITFLLRSSLESFTF